MLASVITVKGVRLAVVLVEPEQTYPSSSAGPLMRAQRIFPTLPIVLLAPRAEGFSRSFATFNLDDIAPHLNADKIHWQEHLPAEPSHDLPF